MLITALFGAVGAWFIVDHVDEFAVVALEALPSALYRHTEISAEILSAPYAAVAQVLAHVYHLKRAPRARARRPVEPQDFAVTYGMDLGTAAAAGE